MVRQGIFFWPRLIFGVVVPIVLAGMIWSTVQIRHTQAATGLLYLAVVALLFGEFFSKFLLFSVNIPLVVLCRSSSASSVSMSFSISSFLLELSAEILLIDLPVLRSR